MFRAETVGNDTRAYVNIFREVNYSSSISTFINSSRYEAGFVVLCKVLGYISKETQILFIVTGAFTAFSFGRFIRKYSTAPDMSILMFLTLGFFDLSMSGVRQMLSIATLLYAFDYLIEKRNLFKFVLVVVIATSFHTSAILFLAMYPLTAVKRIRKMIWLSGMAAVVGFVAFDYLLIIIGKVFPMYVTYFTMSGGSYSNTVKLASVLMLVLWLLIYLVGSYYKSRNSNSLRPSESLSAADVKKAVISAENIHEIASWLGVLFLFLSLHGTILNRFKYVFSVSMLVFYPNSCVSIRNSANRLTIKIVSIVVFVLYALIIYVFRSEWQSTYPYQFFGN